MKICAIIATYNAKRWIDRCFGSLISSSVKLDIVVIDNGSTDGTVEYLKEKFDFVVADSDSQDTNNVIFPQNENLGFGKANNIGIKYALENGADYVFLLNQDAWIQKKTIAELLKIFASDIGGCSREARLHQIGVVAPIQTDGSGENLDYNFQTIYLNNDNTQNFINDLYFNRLKDCYETRCVNAAAWLVRGECIEKVGGFDTSLFYHYGEDWNYCQRVSYHGFKILLAPKIAVCHDRAERKGKFLGNFGQFWNEIAYKLDWGNTLIADNKIDNEFARLKIIYVKQVLKSVLRLKFRRVLRLRKKFLADIKLLETIRESRNLNKKGGRVWLKN